MVPKSTRLRRALITGAFVAGTGLGAAGIASAATSSTTVATTGSSSTTLSSGSASSAPPAGTAVDPATLAHGPGETLLTGTDLQSATAAATAAVPGATVIRAETDSSGASPYEVHMKKADGTYVTVELDSSFKVITTVSGFGAGPAGGQAPNNTTPPSASANAAA
jgi:hypothetical protein